MIARVKVYAADGTTARTADVGSGAGILPTSELRFSVEVGGGGGCTFTALHDDLDTLAAWDSVIHVQLETAASVWTSVAAYTLRPPFEWAKVGFQQVKCRGVAVLEQWAKETVLMPEYSEGNIHRGAGTDRGIGWMSTAYDPDSDPTETWSGIYEVSTSTRSTYPTESITVPGTSWPTASGAKWVSITGATDVAERKLFRTASGSDLTITVPGPVRVFIASDSPGTLYVAGEPVLRVWGGEPGKEPILFEQADLYMEAGSYAVAFDTSSIWNAGGDGVDPVIIAICSLDADMDPDAWLLVSDATDWVACRRNDEPPGDEPPGPTPGQLLDALFTEAQDRYASGWAGVTWDFTGTADTYEVTWPAIVVERLVRYAADTYWTVLQMLAETLEVDVWMDPDLTVHAAPTQGEDVTASVTLDETDIATMSAENAPDAGSWVAALALDGWVQASSGSPRREYGMELGTAISMPVAGRVLEASLAENGRWDATAALGPSAPTPLVAFAVGDTLTLDYPTAPTSVRVLSVAGEAGDGGVLWEMELVEVPS